MDGKKKFGRSKKFEERRLKIKLVFGKKNEKSKNQMIV
jgi:hypothetical protein